MSKDIVLSSRTQLNDLLTTITGSLKVFENAPFIGSAVKIVFIIVELVLVRKL
jgi:hypothetical protein